jgi:hypothetical protein
MPSGRSWQRHVESTDPRHSPDWYDQSAEPTVLLAGDRMFIACEGGPCQSRLEYFPPRLEIHEDDGTYALIDIGTHSAWKYLFVPRPTT